MIFFKTQTVWELQKGFDIFIQKTTKHAARLIDTNAFATVSFFHDFTVPVISFKHGATCMEINFVYHFFSLFHILNEEMV